jgi:hypothetical protein
MAVVTQLGERGIGLNRVYTMEEIDAMLVNAANGGPAGGFTDATPIAYATPAITNSGGQPIGLSPDGLTITRPPIVGGLPVVVDGKRYLIALIEE